MQRSGMVPQPQRKGLLDLTPAVCCSTANLGYLIAKCRRVVKRLHIFDSLISLVELKRRMSPITASFFDRLVGVQKAMAYLEIAVLWDGRHFC